MKTSYIMSSCCVLSRATKQALQRDGWFFIQDAAVGGGCSPVVQGYRLGAPASHLLRRHVQCALAADCPAAETLREGVVSSFGNWWGLPPMRAEGLGLECYDSSIAKIWSEDFDDDGAGEEEEEAGTGSGGEEELIALSLCAATEVALSSVANGISLSFSLQGRSRTCRGRGTRRR